MTSPAHQRFGLPDECRIVPTLMHVPKTGGTAFTSYLRAQFSAPHIRGWEPAVTKKIASGRAANLVVVRGGIPDIWRWQTDETKYVPIVIVRDPIERALSQYYQYARGTHLANKFGVKVGMLLDEFLYHPFGIAVIKSYQIDSLIRPFADILYRNGDRWCFVEPAQRPDHGNLWHACAVLERYCVMGTTERLNKLRTKVYDTFRPKTPIARLHRENVSGNRIQRKHITKAQTKRIEELVEDDQKLYDFAKTL